MQQVWTNGWNVVGARRVVVTALALAAAVVAVPARADDGASAVAEPSVAAEPSAPPPEVEAAPPGPSGPHTANSLQLGLGFRYGAMLSDGDPNPWGTGLGLDLGYTLPSAVYVGGNFEYFFGESSEALGLKLNANILQFSLEGGYDIGIGQSFVIRPKLGVGLAHLASSVEGCPPEVTCTGGSSETKAALAPGATFLFYAKQFSLALDVRYDVVFTDPSRKALIFSVGVGF